MVGTVLDITEHKAWRWSFLQAQKMEAIGQLAAGIAHDFKQRARPDRHGRVASAAEGPRSLEASTCATSIEQSRAPRAALVHQMLSFAKARFGEKRIVSGPHILSDGDDLVESTLPEIHPRSTFAPAE